jgi:hypothetical protein
VFKNPILSLLQRQPAERASLAAFCTACQALFAGNSTTVVSPMRLPQGKEFKPDL